MFDKDLIYICECYEDWPKDIDLLFYCYDGEVLSRGGVSFTDYPQGYLKPKSNPNFVAKEGFTCVGKDYTKEDFLKCKEYLATFDNPVDDSTDPVIEKVKLRIQEITKRHEQALSDELKPLLEVLQRRGEVL